MANQLIAGIVALLVLMVIGITVVLPVLLDVTNRASAAQSINGETVNCANNTILQLGHHNILNSGSFVLKNATGLVIQSTNYTLTLTTGRLFVGFPSPINNTLYGTSCLAYYSYNDDSYLASGSSRTVVGLLPLLIVIALAVAIVAYFKFR